MKKNIGAFIALAAGILWLHAMATADASAKEVEVHLPAFNVSINAYSPLMEYNPYPPIVYKDITYVPMTWDNSLRMNLALDWREGEGLAIRQHTSTGSPWTGPETGKKVNDLNHMYQAQIPTYPISVNGKAIANDQEPYPVLSFRDITYFPLTWRFTHDEFGWATAWSPEEGFSLVSGDSKYIMSSITGDDENDLFVNTYIYGTIRVNKSFDGLLEAVPNGQINAIYDQPAPEKGLRQMEKHPDALSHQTRIVGDHILLGQIQIMSVKDLLIQANRPNISRTYTEQDIELEDTVIPLGSSRLIRLSTALPGLDSILLFEHEGKVSALDHNLFYRMISAADGSYWLSSAYKQSETHTYYSRHEQHLWLIGKDGNIRSIHDQLGVPMIRVLSGLSDGSLLVLASDNDRDQTEGDVYRLQTNGQAQKLYSALQGKVYADAAGEVYVLSPDQNRISKLGSGESVELTEKMLFLTAKGQPQAINKMIQNP